MAGQLRCRRIRPVAHLPGGGLNLFAALLAEQLTVSQRQTHRGIGHAHGTGNVALGDRPVGGWVCHQAT